MSQLSFSNKPEILRLHQLEEQERSKFCTDFSLVLSELLPSAILRNVRSSNWLTKLLNIIPDLYYTFVTINYCRRRLGQEYTYIAMYKKQHYENEGVLLNQNTRTLLTVLELISRHAFLPYIIKILQKTMNDSGFNLNQEWWSKLKNRIVKYIGSGEQIVANIQWIVLMLFMLNWSKRFTILQKILKISYIYAYKNQQVQDISYKLEGYLILITMIVKIAKHLYSLYSESKKIKQKQVNLLPPKAKIELDQGQASKNEQKVLCRICYDDMRDRSATKCGHIFCWSCIIKTLQMSEQCPVCRTNCLPRQVVQLRNY